MFVVVPKAASRSIIAWMTDPAEEPKKVYGRSLPALSSRRYFTFSFVRDPYARVLSAWRDKVERGAKDLDGLGDGQPNFPEFVRRIAASDPARVNAHVRPQHLLVPHWVRFVGRVERLDADLQELGRQLGRSNGEASRRNASPDASVAEFYDTATTKLVQQLYEADFHRFGYDSSFEPLVGS